MDAKINDHAEALYSYKDPHVRDAIWALKYYKQTHFGRWFGKIMHEYLVGEIFEENLDGNVEILLIPIPLSYKRLLERGYNQSELLAHAIRDCDTNNYFEVKTDVVRKRETKHQAHTKNKKERVQNIKDSFVIKNKEQILGRDIIIIDDVITTGATTNEVRELLLQAGARKVTILAIAH